ncbi:MAG: RNA-directed DNA polymerase [Acholeplasmataceae bacterium]|nr:RNA-directed DNA polymerase [Acholeplasmataceae bacterium]
MLINKTYIHSPYIEGEIKDGISRKERIIHKPKFYPDQIIHWALMLQIQGIIVRGMYHWSCACVKKRGMHYAKKGCEKWMQNDRANTKYCLKFDIQKFYPSIDLELLKEKFRRVIKDRDTLWLIDTIIDSHDKGIPIGNYTSQWFANFYLQDMDHFIKEQVGVKRYMRYMDDFTLFGSNKRNLKKTFLILKKEFEKEHLTIKSNWQIFNTEKRRLDFCGFVYTREKTFVRKRITRNMRRQYFKFQKSHSLKSAQALMSYYGWLKNSDSYILFRKYFYNIKQMKGVIYENSIKSIA